MVNRLGYTRHVYEVSSVQKSNLCYKIVEVYNGTKQLTDIVRIEKYRGYSNSKFNENYFRIKDNPYWKDCTMLTGLRETLKPNVFYGDSIQNKKSLILFQLSDDKTTLIIDVFKGFYPTQKTLNRIIKHHNYEL